MKPLETISGRYLNRHHEQYEGRYVTLPFEVEVTVQQEHGRGSEQVYANADVILDTMDADGTWTAQVIDPTTATPIAEATAEVQVQATDAVQVWR